MHLEAFVGPMVPFFKILPSLTYRLFGNTVSFKSYRNELIAESILATISANLVKIAQF